MPQRGYYHVVLRLGILLLGARASTQVHAQVQTSVSAPSLATATAPLVLRGVTVIDVRTGKHLPNRTVTIIGNRIDAITLAEQARVPKGARVVRAQGKYLIPGLWDMHVHPERYADFAFPLYVANGVTGVRDAGSEAPLAQLVQWKREIAAGTRVGPRYLVSGPTLNSGDSSQTRITVPNTTGGWAMYVNVPPALARYAVDSLQAAGADFLKFYGLSRRMYLKMAAEARRVRILFGGHLPEGDSGVGGREASDSGATFLDHGPWIAVCGDNMSANGLDAAQCAAAAERLRHNNTWITMLGLQATALFPARLADHMRRYLPASLPWSGTKDNKVPNPTSTADWTRAWEAREWKDNDHWGPYVSKLIAAKMPFLVGSDGSMATGGAFTRSILAGFAVPETMMSFVLAGMTPLEALQTATINPALALRATDSLGTVEVGKVADLVLLDADPLMDIWNTTKVWGVLANGHYYDRAVLDELLTETEQAAARR